MRINLPTVLFRFLDYFSPSYCSNCGISVRYEDSNLCEKCFSEIKFLSDKCERCSGILTDDFCNTCSNRKFYIEKNITIAEYSGVMKEIIRKYKFSKVRRLYKHFAKLTYNEITQYQDSFDIITSVPINKIKKWRRGFNQSELIAKAVAKRINKEYHILLKDRYKFKTQKKLSYRDRFINIINRYKAVNENNIKGKNIIIVDDIFTTGATLNECARILLSKGANRVYSLTIAGADIKRLDKL